MKDHGSKVVLLIATLDTKFEEILYLKNGIEKCGKRTLIIDCGLRSSTEALLVKPDITREELVISGGTDFGCFESKDRIGRMKIMENLLN